LKECDASGIIESYLISQLKGRTVRHVGIACVIDMPGDRKVDLAPDFSLFVENEGHSPATAWNTSGPTATCRTSPKSSEDESLMDIIQRVLLHGA